jgi:signal transduction histidine kinase
VQAEILAEIDRRLGFVPPFFGPAAGQPDLLANLWQQTRIAYLENPLPSLLKEKLGAVLGRYCPVPYCFVCHTCSLPPLGMRAGAILELLRLSPGDEDSLEACLRRFADLPAGCGLPEPGTPAEEDLFALCCAIYFGSILASRARAVLRDALSGSDYDYLLVFISYNRMCHDWVAAHPEISFELDRRYLEHGRRLASDDPRIAELFGTDLVDRGQWQGEDGSREVALQRAREAERMNELSEARLYEVLGALTERVEQGVREASELRQLRAQAEASAQLAQELLAIVSHDLRGPIMAITTAASLLERVVSPEDRFTRPLRRIFSSTLRAQRLIEDLLDFTLARAGGGIPIHREPVGAEQLVRQVADELELAHPGRIIEVEQCGDCSGEWDPERLKQVVSNLLDNALTNSPADGVVTVAVRGGEELAIATRNANRNGPIPPDIMGILFKPFKPRVPGTVSRRNNVGLGLYIVDQIVRAHGGRIEVNSDAAATAFVVHLPRFRPRLAAASCR